MSSMELRVNAERLRADIDALAQIGRQENHGIYRMAFSAADMAGREWFRQRIEDAATDLRAMEASEIDAMAEKPVTFRIGDMEIPFTAEGFVLSFSLPNLYFHTTTTYAILRAAGVPLGKRDFLGQMQVAG